MEATPTRPVPRVRTRLKAGKRVSLAGLAARALRGDLPNNLAARVRSMAARNSPEVMPLIYDALVQLRMAGLPHEEIARRFGVNVRTVYRWWEKAKPWLQEQYTRLDPAATYSEQMAEFDRRRERLVKLLIMADDARESARLSAALDRLSDTRRKWMQAHGYFDAIAFRDVAQLEQSRSEREARLIREALADAFRGVIEGVEMDPVG